MVISSCVGRQADVPSAADKMKMRPEETSRLDTPRVMQRLHDQREKAGSFRFLPEHGNRGGSCPRRGK
jgi:hypothetical protein